MADDPNAPQREPPVRATETREGTAVVSLVGELDLYNAEELRAGLAGVLAPALGRGTGRVVVDLSDVEFIDSTALGVLVEASSKLGHGRLLLAAAKPEARRTLQVSGLDRHLPVHDSVEHALAADP